MARTRVVRVVRHRGDGGGMGKSRLRGVVFDMDGTLVVQELDFEAIRRESRCCSSARSLATRCNDA